MPKKPQKLARTPEETLFWDLVGARDAYQSTTRMLCARALVMGMEPATVRRMVQESLVQGLDPNDLKRAGMALEMADAMLGYSKVRPS